ncbi:hypothetical protein B0H11DRAFT_1314031 [Mycena galericulata]|nr:hypothetical protein B0H11DRAFT_1313849 [Mycena galericulata]KAJ7509288.1 hypothetical protein B0H11DRAFT_1314031 [Mycena galericulata]
MELGYALRNKPSPERWCCPFSTADCDSRINSVPFFSLNLGVPTRLDDPDISILHFWYSLSACLAICVYSSCLHNGKILPDWLTANITPNLPEWQPLRPHQARFTISMHIAKAEDDGSIFQGPDTYSILLDIELQGQPRSPLMYIGRFVGSSEDGDAPMWTRFLKRSSFGLWYDRYTCRVGFGMLGLSDGVRHGLRSLSGLFGSVECGKLVLDLGRWCASEWP